MKYEGIVIMDDGDVFAKHGEGITLFATEVNLSSVDQLGQRGGDGIKMIESMWRSGGVSEYGATQIAVKTIEDARMLLEAGEATTVRVGIKSIF